MGKGGNASAKADTKEVLIEGRFYDVSSFKHPGGSNINFLSGSGADATPTYREFHTRYVQPHARCSPAARRRATPHTFVRLAGRQRHPSGCGSRWRAHEHEPGHALYQDGYMPVRPCVRAAAARAGAGLPRHVKRDLLGIVAGIYAQWTF
jgi:hypothetical protein